ETGVDIGENAEAGLILGGVTHDAELDDGLVAMFGLRGVELDSRVDRLALEQQAVAADIRNAERCQDIARGIGEQCVGRGRDETALELPLSVADEFQIGAKAGAQRRHPIRLLDYLPAQRGAPRLDVAWIALAVVLDQKGLARALADIARANGICAICGGAA